MATITRVWKIYGTVGHRQRMSFGESFVWDFSKDGDVRVLELQAADKTGTHDYVIFKITRNTAEECERELWGQITDGTFENSRVGNVEEIKECV